MSDCSTVERVIDPARQGVASHEPGSADESAQAAPLTVEEACALVDSWAEGFAPFRMHQVARALRGHVDYLEQRLAEARIECGDIGADRDEYRERADALFVENNDLRFRLGRLGIPLDKADYRSPPLTLEETLDRMAAWRDDVEVWGLHQMCRALRSEWLLAVKDGEAWEAAHDKMAEAWSADVLALSEEHGSEIERWTDRIWRACQAVPCSAGLDDCHAPYYRFSPCCNLRVALLPGEPFPTDFLPDEGFIHLFEPGRGNMPRVSAGCFRLVEPTAARRFDENIEAMLDDAERATGTLAKEGWER